MTGNTSATRFRSSLAASTILSLATGAGLAWVPGKKYFISRTKGTKLKKFFIPARQGNGTSEDRTRASTAVEAAESLASADATGRLRKGRMSRSFPKSPF